jgi:UTP:GlnB (protein PII) uridylyltransferase
VVINPDYFTLLLEFLTKHQVDIKNAKINTMGERVEDTLLISGDVLSSARETLRLQKRSGGRAQSSAQIKRDRYSIKPKVEKSLMRAGYKIPSK